MLRKRFYTRPLNRERYGILPKTGAFLVEKYGTHLGAFPKDSLGSITTKYDKNTKKV